MRIGIDIDDTTFLTFKYMLKYADIYENEISGVPVNKDNFGLIKNCYYLNTLYGWDDKTKSDFFNKYYKMVLEECTILPYAKEVINKLKEEGNTIHFITARIMDIEGCDAEAITKNSLNKFGVLYDSLNLQIKDKCSFVKDNNIDLLIDDSYDICKEVTSKGEKALLMKTKMNERIDDSSIIRVSDWNEIYNVIHNNF